MKIAGFYDDQGNELNPDLYPKPQLCLSCMSDEDPAEDILCNLNRLDQVGEETFKCYCYVNKFK